MSIQPFLNSIWHLSQEEKELKLREAGFNEDQIQLFTTPLSITRPCKKGGDLPFLQTDEGIAMTERIKKYINQPKSNNLPAIPQYSQFEKDVILNRFLMNGSTILDDASMHNPKIKQTEVTRWFENEFYPKGYRSALIIGGPGAGKTWGTLAWMNSITKFDVDACTGRITHYDSVFITAFRLAEMFHNSKKFHDELANILSKPKLMIDDLGAEPAGFRGSDFVAYFDYLFSERHKYRRFTFLTSNGSVNDKKLPNGALIPGLKTIYGERFISRFNENGRFLETKDEDMRGDKV